MQFIDMMRTKVWSAILLAGGILAGCHGNPSSDRLTEAARQTSQPVDRVEVTATVVRERDFARQLISSGKLVARQKADLTFEVSGRLTRIYVKEGDYVAARTALAAIDDREQRDAYESADMTEKRARTLFRKNMIDFYGLVDETSWSSIPDSMVELQSIAAGYKEAQNRKKSTAEKLEACTLRAPFAGKIASINGVVHETTTGKPFCTLIDDSFLDVNFGILETEYGFVHVGQTLSVAPFHDLQHLVSGTVVSVNPTVDDKGQISIKARIKNDGSLLDGMNVRVIVEEREAGQLVVPKSAVVIRDNMEVLFRKENGRSVWTYVHVLMSNATDCAVVPNTGRGSTLAPGDSVIVSGNLNLGDNVPVSLMSE